MTLRIVTNGRSLTKTFFAQKNKTEWVEKLYNNIRRKLNRLGDVVALDPASLTPGRGVTLNFSGTPEHQARIEKVLGVKFENGQATVKFSRLTTTVKLVAKPQLFSIFLDRVSKQKVA